MVYVILFSGDVKWTARVPGRSVSSFGEFEARQLLSDIRTRSYIRASTSIPISEVFAWDLSQDNPFEVPYHFGSFVEAKPLGERCTKQFSEVEKDGSA